jgi:hypothetical protein
VTYIERTGYDFVSNQMLEFVNRSGRGERPMPNVSKNVVTKPIAVPSGVGQLFQHGLN